MDVITITATLTLGDWRAFQAAASRRMQQGDTPGGLWLRIVAFALATAVALLLVDGLTRSHDLVSFGAGVLVVLTGGSVLSWQMRRRMTPEPNGAFLGHCTYALDSAGVRASRSQSHSFASWDAVIDVTRTATHVFLWVDRFSGYSIPTRDLPEAWTPERLTAWIDTERARVATLPTTGLPSATTAAPGDEPPRAVHGTPAPHGDIGRSLLDLGNLIALRGKANLAGRYQGAIALLATLLALGTWTVADRAAGGPDLQFFVYGVSDVAWYLLGGLAIAWVLARTSGPGIAFARAATATAVGAWLAILYAYLGDSFATRGWLGSGLFIAAMLYALAYFIQAARALSGDANRRTGVVAFGAAMAFLWISEQLFVTANVWVPSDARADSGWRRDAVEPLLFSQRDRVDATLDAVTRNDSAAAQVFFVGFAGYGDQKVFAEEIKFAANAVAARYHTDMRSLLLLNDARDTDTAPLATASTLRYALRGIAHKMSLDDDILFLALSSHGSRDRSLTVENGVLPLADVRAEDLADALDDAGIKWRVIVISACYAGGFVDTLKNPHTIVLAAAAPDRTSFGCSNDRDLTNFGEAFYRDALPAATSLRDAFVQTQRLVRDRESAGGVDPPSEPTAFFGEEIERKVAALEN